MWVMTSFGIFMPSLRPAEHVPAGDERKLQIRARRSVELARLRKLYLTPEHEIVYLPFTDYEYRIYCTHQEWADVMAKLALDIDYVKFKDTTARWNDGALHDAYIAIWGLLYRRFSTNHAFDVTRTTRATVKFGRKGKKRKGRRGAEQVDAVLSEYERYHRWWDEVEPIDPGDPGWK